MTRILLIEDEPTIAQNIKERLTAELYRVEWANNGITGLNKALFEIYSLIILDILLQTEAIQKVEYNSESFYVRKFKF